MATTFTPESDVWIKGHDQFGNTCWYNKETYELHYFYDSPRHPAARLPRGISYSAEAPQPHIHIPTGPSFAPAARAPSSAEMPTTPLLPSNMALQGDSRNRASSSIIRTKQERKPPVKTNAPANDFEAFSEGQDILHHREKKKVLRERVNSSNNDPTQQKRVSNVLPGETRGIAPGTNDMRAFPLFPLNNTVHAAARPQAMKPPYPRMAPKQEENPWRLKVDEKGETYYFNTKTLEWQMETPDCFKKYTAKG